MKNILVVVILLLASGVSNAGCYGNKCAADRKVEEDTRNMLDRGYTYGQIGKQNSDTMWPIYNSNHEIESINPSQNQITPEQQEEIAEINRRVNGILDPNTVMNQTIMGTPGAYMSPNPNQQIELQELNRQTDALMDPNSPANQIIFGR